MPNHLAFLHSGLQSPGEKAFEDGKRLAAGCLDGLRPLDPEHFPPRLLILLASAAYAEHPRARQLLAGVHDGFAKSGLHDVPLVGTSVAGVFFEGRLHARGAVLVCLASRLLQAKVAAGIGVGADPAKSARSLIDGLGIHADSEETSPPEDSLLLAFFPGLAVGTLPDRLHELLLEALQYRLSVIGGVASVNDPTKMKRTPLFAGTAVYDDALVAARLTSPHPLGISLGRGLKPTGTTLRVAALSDDKRKITRFDEAHKADEILKKAAGPVLLGRASRDADWIVAVARHPQNLEVQVLRDTEEGAVLDVLQFDPGEMSDSTTRMIQDSIRRVRIERPVGCLSLRCVSHDRFGKEIGLDVEAAIASTESAISGVPCVGGLVDGEVGQDQSGRSVSTNWNVVSIVFGDEMRDRSIWQNGMLAVAGRGPSLVQTNSLEEVLRGCLDLVWDAGFPGAMLSMPFRKDPHLRVVALDAVGSRFSKVRDDTSRDALGEDILAHVARTKEPVYVPDSRLDPRCDHEAVVKSGIISQHVSPLCNAEDEVIGMLQVDLGDLGDKSVLRPLESALVRSLNALVATSMARALRLEEARIQRSLDMALQECLSERTVQRGLLRFLAASLNAFGAAFGHIRLAEQQSLTLVGGSGSYYESVEKKRRHIDISDRSPTCEAFREGRTIVLNNAQDHRDQRLLIERYQSEPEILAALKGVGASAVTAFRNERGQSMGTLTMGSPSPWFFNSCRVTCLEVFRQRAGFLAEHLRRKVSDAVSRKRVQFLLETGPRLASTHNFRDPRRILEDATKRFAEAANAEVASLYLLDEDLQQLILSAQHGWFHPGWVDAARWDQQGWVGKVAFENQPRYIDNLHKFLADTYHEPQVEFVSEMFGSELPQGITLEVITLPLRLGDTRLGILNLYRRARVGDAGRFEVTDQDILQEAADNMAALASAVLSYQQAVRTEGDRRVREEVQRVFIEPRDGTRVEESLCDRLVELLEAESADFYLVDATGGTPPLIWTAGWPAPTSGSSPPAAPDPWLLAASRSGRSSLCRRRFQRKVVNNPDRAALEGSPERGCIVFGTHPPFAGVIDLRWPADRKHSLCSLSPAPRSADQLRALADLIAYAYGAHALARERERARQAEESSKRATVALGAMVVQSAHRFINLVQTLRSITSQINDAPTEEARASHIKDLSKVVSTATRTVKRPLDVAQRIHLARSAPHDLAELVNDALREVPAPLPEHSLSVNVPTAIRVLVNREQVQAALENLIHNAYKAMPVGGALTVSGSVGDKDKAARILLRDTGVGMTQDETAAALAGFVTTKGSSGLGVLLSKVLIEGQGGVLSIDSIEKVGTTITVTLPLVPEEV